MKNTTDQRWDNPNGFSQLQWLGKMSEFDLWFAKGFAGGTQTPQLILQYGPGDEWMCKPYEDMAYLHAYLHAVTIVKGCGIKP